MYLTGGNWCIFYVALAVCHFKVTRIPHVVCDYTQFINSNEALHENL